MKPVIAAVLFVCVLLSACSAGQALPSNKISDAIPTEQATANEVQTAESTALPSPSIDTSYIPSIVPNASVSAAQPKWIYEDKDYIYYLRWHGPVHPVYRIRKSDNTKECIIENCVDFTLNNGAIYYSKTMPNKSCTVYRYDTMSKKSLSVFKCKLPISNIALYEGRFYFLSGGTEDYSDLYSCNLSGGDSKILASGVLEFCISGGRICYYGKYVDKSGDGYDEEPDEAYDGYNEDTDTEYEGWEGEDSSDGEFEDDEYNGDYEVDEYYDIIECSLDGSGKKDIDYLDVGFGAAGGKLFYNSSNLTVYDMETGKISYPGDGYCDFAFSGQYMFFASKNFDWDDTMLRAYDINTGVVYDLFEVPEEWRFKEYSFGISETLSGTDTAYFIVSDKDSDTLYRIVIENGKAGYKKVGVFEGATYNVSVPLPSPSVQN